MHCALTDGFTPACDLTLGPWRYHILFRRQANQGHVMVQDHRSLQLEQNKLGACRAAHCLGHWDPLQVCLSRLWVLVNCTQPYLVSCERFVA